MNSPEADHWKTLAQQWSALRPPLRPCAEDVQIPRAVIEKWLENDRGKGPTVLVLGITSELCSLPVNGNGRIIAVDKSADMIRALWHSPGAHARVIHADWRDIPLDEASVDLVLGDGSFCLLPFPAGHRDVWGELRRLLRPDGRCAIRFFVQPPTRETVEQVFADLKRGLIGNVHALKWRLAMALQKSAVTGVALEDVWETLHAEWPNLKSLSENFGWPENEVQTIDAYRGVKTRYAFPTLDELTRLVSSTGFSVIQIVTPSYELGERCPTLVLERQ